MGRWVAGDMRGFLVGRIGGGVNGMDEWIYCGKDEWAGGWVV
jgi:hypothetical protein